MYRSEMIWKTQSLMEVKENPAVTVAAIVCTHTTYLIISMIVNIDLSLVHLATVFRLRSQRDPCLLSRDLIEC